MSSSILQMDMEIISGHHKVEMNRVVMEDVFTTMYKFDEVSRTISDFQERCDEYQKDVKNVLLAALPVVINKGKSLNFLISNMIVQYKFCFNIMCYYLSAV